MALGFTGGILVEGTLCYLALGVIATIIGLIFFAKPTPATSKADATALTLVTVWVSVVCMWAMWAMAYMHQMVPLIYPTH
mmetsp:Transcript_23809/g.52440  ORF Transcript_23809/g.52440 Transcript_23809/m.52440 type:complete len:80 (+) Transcript_23809:83-322(+)